MADNRYYENQAPSLRRSRGSHECCGAQARRVQSDIREIGRRKPALAPRQLHLSASAM